MGSNTIFLFLTSFFLMTCTTIIKDKTIGTNAKGINSYKSSIPKTTSIEAKQIASELETSYVAEITFSRGQKTVPLNAKNEIKRLFERARKKGNVESVKLITWADEEYPSKQKKVLNKDQLKLVEDRNDNLEAYIEKFSRHLNVNKISMAERPGVMESILSQEDKRLKKSIEAKGIPTTAHKQGTARASKSIVMLVFEK